MFKDNKCKICGHYRSHPKHTDDCSKKMQQKRMETSKNEPSHGRKMVKVGKGKRYAPEFY